MVPKVPEDVRLCVSRAEERSEPGSFFEHLTERFHGRKVPRKGQVTDQERKRGSGVGCKSVALQGGSAICGLRNLAAKHFQGDPDEFPQHFFVLKDQNARRVAAFFRTLR